MDLPRVGIANVSFGVRKNTAAPSWIRYPAATSTVSMTPTTKRHRRAEISLWVRNPTDKNHINNYINFGPSFGNMITANWDPPRTCGATFIYRW